MKTKNYFEVDSEGNEWFISIDSNGIFLFRRILMKKMNMILADAEMSKMENIKSSFMKN